jgi:hypothetical protein
MAEKFQNLPKDIKVQEWQVKSKELYHEVPSEN